MMPDLFKEIVPSILQTKNNVFENENDYGDYNSYIINRALSFHLDCVFHVNELNQYPSIEPDMQYQYLLNSVRPMKRKFVPWQKADIVKDLECVKEYFGYSNEKAKEALRLLTNDQLEKIRKLTDKGGVK
jgi:Bacteriophage clamp loader A subunit